MSIYAPAGTNGGSAPSSPVSGMTKRSKKRLTPKLSLSSNVNEDEIQAVVKFGSTHSLHLTPTSNPGSQNSNFDPAHFAAPRTASAPFSSPDERYFGARSISESFGQSPVAHLDMSSAARCTSDSFVSEHEPVVYESIAGSISPRSSLNEYARHLKDGEDKRYSDPIEAWTRQDEAGHQRGDGAEGEMRLADLAAVERVLATTI